MAVTRNCRPVAFTFFETIRTATFIREQAAVEMMLDLQVIEIRE
jgi:hypothetical protein